MIRDRLATLPMILTAWPIAARLHRALREMNKLDQKRVVIVVDVDDQPDAQQVVTDKHPESPDAPSVLTQDHGSG